MLRWTMIFPFDGGEVRGQQLSLKAIGKRLHIRIIERELSRGPSPETAACPCRQYPTSSTASTSSS